MRRIDRPGYFVRDKSKAYHQRQEAIARLKLMQGMTEQEARAFLREQVKLYRAKTRPYELCAAKTRKNTPCKALALPNGRCRFHGGMSTGPKTPEGKAKSLLNLHWQKKR
jgi:hypothetical protein